MLLDICGQQFLIQHSLCLLPHPKSDHMSDLLSLQNLSATINKKNKNNSLPTSQKTNVNIQII